MHKLSSLCTWLGSCSTGTLGLLPLWIITRRSALGLQVIFILLFLSLIKFSKLFDLGLSEFLPRSIMSGHPLKGNVLVLKTTTRRTKTIKQIQQTI